MFRKSYNAVKYFALIVLIVAIVDQNDDVI